MRVCIHRMKAVAVATKIKYIHVHSTQRATWVVCISVFECVHVSATKMATSVFKVFALLPCEEKVHKPKHTVLSLKPDTIRRLTVLLTRHFF